MCEYKDKKHKHKTHKIGEARFVEEQWEEGVEKKIGKSPSTSLWKVNKVR